jgi:hypothetical protein
MQFLAEKLDEDYLVRFENTAEDLEKAEKKRYKLTLDLFEVDERIKELNERFKGEGVRGKDSEF